MITASDVVAVGSLAVASWAAWTAHSARRWQQHRDQERDLTRVRVSVDHTVKGAPVGIRFLDDDPRPEPVGYGLTAHVINDGAATEYVRSVDLVAAGGVVAARAWELTLDRSGNADCELVPRGRVEAELYVYEARLDELPDRFVIKAELASGQIVASDPQDFVDELVASIREHNTRAR